MARTRTGQGTAGAAAPTTPRVDPRQCVWLTRGRRCLFLGTVIIGENPGTHYCAWHAECLRTPRLAEAFEEFARWCGQLRARGDCGEYFDFSHAPVPWLYQLLIGDDRAAFEPPGGRTGCAKSSCYYGWTGTPAAAAFAPPRPIVATTPGPLIEPLAPGPAPVRVGESLPAWITEDAR